MNEELGTFAKSLFLWFKHKQKTIWLKAWDLVKSVEFG
jgi:hypothetical protein